MQFSIDNSLIIFTKGFINKLFIYQLRLCHEWEDFVSALQFQHILRKIPKQTEGFLFYLRAASYLM